MRTTFTEEQVQILQANFQIDSNPDGQDLERIAQITGLSKRVTQVSFLLISFYKKKNAYEIDSSLLDKKIYKHNFFCRFGFKIAVQDRKNT